MAKKLVIVESPAKAKTIKGYLGSDYEVEASVGHIRDLPPNGKGLPAEQRKLWWADYAVDVDNNFEPIYEVPAEKSAQVKRLRDAMKGKDTLVLATDEDREGESISWHLLQVLKPGKGVEVKRIAFHEITKEAILAALQNPRTIDTCLVEAQETRRILDRLYGYTLSPVLWTKVTKNLSAGRVQSPAVKLIVEREVQRRNFRSAGYWDLKAELSADKTPFPSDLKTIDSQRVASGGDFDETTGELKTSRGEKVLVLDEKRAKELALACRDAKPWTISNIEANEAQERPAPPFMTTTLQQDANRKFGFSADRTMRIAQTLYEGVEMGGEQTGLITYMRTDSLTLSQTAIDNVRGLIRSEYPDCLPDKPVVYTSKVRNAQEAHEAIRPTDVARNPRSIERYLSEDQRKIYDLIWKRTVACQMKPARVLKTEVQIDVKIPGHALGFRSSGKQILFEGFRRVYLEGSDDPDGDREGLERRLPTLKEGMEVALNSVDPVGHVTKPPARYTDATLIKKLEEMGIGRPSTYASIIAVIVDRGYVRKQGKQLIPTFKAFLAMEVLEQNFAEFMELDFTRNMDDVLDEIASGKEQSKAYLKRFFLGDGETPGLKQAVDDRKREIPFPVFVVGEDPASGKKILVRNGRTGDAFIQLGEDGDKRYANVPDDLAPADLTVEKAIELLNQKSAPLESVGTYLATGKRLLLKNRAGFYLEVERTAEELEAKDKPTWVSVPPGIDPRTLSQDDLNYLCTLPVTVGKNPDTGDDITFRVGKYGPYLQSGKEIRNVEDWRAGSSLDVLRSMEILAQPKFQRQARAAAAPLKEFAQTEIEGAAGAVRVLSGRFGPYVTDGEVNATLPKSVDPTTISAEVAKELLDRKRAAGPAPARGRFGKKPVAKKPAAKAKTTTKKPAAKPKKTK